MRIVSLMPGLSIGWTCAMDWSQPPLRISGCKGQTSLAAEQRLSAANEYSDQHKTSASTHSDSARQAQGKRDACIGDVSKAVVR